MIEDFYIGASISIRSRIISHINLAFSNLRLYRSIDSLLHKKILETYINKGYVDIYYLCDDPLKEKFYYDLHKPVCNNTVKGNFYHQMFKKVI